MIARAVSAIAALVRRAGVKVLTQMRTDRMDYEEGKMPRGCDIRRGAGCVGCKGEWGPLTQGYG